MTPRLTRGAAIGDPGTIIAGLVRSPESMRRVAIDLLRDGLERLEEDLAEEQFFAVARVAYWAGGEGSRRLTLAAALIDRLEF